MVRKTAECYAAFVGFACGLILVKRGLQDPASHRQLPLLVCPALDGGCLAMPRDHSHSLVNPGDHVVRRAALQESDAVLAASRQDAVARRLHFHWVRLAWNCEVAERKT